jgi:hypothetical protein
MFRKNLLQVALLLGFLLQRLQVLLEQVSHRMDGLEFKEPRSESDLFHWCMRRDVCRKWRVG